MSNPYDIQKIKQFAVDRLDFHKRMHLPLLRGYQESGEIFFWMDSMIGDVCAEMKFSAIKGEMTDEQRTVDQVHTVQVFETWKDHLKFVIRRDWTWLPEWASRRLRVDYVPVSEKFSVTVPVKVTKICPHADIQWGRDMVKHMKWAEPVKFKDWQ